MKNPATLAAGAIVAALALFSALAPAQAETLVSNIGQTATTTTSKSPSQNELAQGFRAGSHAALSSIAIKFGGSFGGGAAPTMTLHSGNPNSTAIATLGGPGWVGERYKKLHLHRSGRHGFSRVNKLFRSDTGRR